MSTLGLPRLVVGYLDDDVPRDRWLDSATDLTAGVLAVTAYPPESSRRPHMSGFVLDALARLGHTGVDDPGKFDTDPMRLAAYLLVAGVTDLVIQHAQWLLADGLEAVRQLTETCGLRLWLAVHPDVTELTREVIDAWTGPDGQLGGGEFVEALEAHTANYRRTVASPWPPRATTTSGEGTADPFPAVPTDDVFTFRATCRAVLTPPEHRMVDKRFMRARDDTLVALAPAVNDAFDAAERGDDGFGPLRAALVTYLSAVLADCVDENEAVVAGRGVQLGLFHLGVFLQVDAERLAMYALGDDVRQFTVDRDGWSRLVVYHDPSRPAVAALVVSGIDVEDIPEVTVGDVDADGSTVRRRGHAVTVPGGARVYLEVARLSRLARGAGFSDPLVANPAGDPLAVKTLVKVLHEPRRKHVARIVPARRHEMDRTARQWLQRRGLAVRALA